MKTPLTVAAVSCLALAVAVPAYAAEKPSDPQSMFAPGTVYSNPLPDDTPTAPDSDRLVAELKRQTETFYGTPDKPMIDVNVDKFAAAIWTATPDDPRSSVRPWNCQGKDAGWEAPLAAQLANIRIPAGLKPDPSSDGSVTIHDPADDTVVDLWQARQASDGTWEACWGGKIDNASKSTTATYEHPYGSSAAGISHAAYVIGHDELTDPARSIEHAVNLMLPEIKAWPAVSWPANRTDGHHTGAALTMGQMLRLPASVDVDKLGLSAPAAKIARAAQEYGIIVTDTAGSVTFQAENPIALDSNDYDEVFGGEWPSESMAGFPIDKLEVLPVDYGKDAAPSQRPEPAVSPAPDASDGDLRTQVEKLQERVDRLENESTPTRTPAPESTRDAEATEQQAEPASLDDELFNATNEFRAQNGGLPPFERDGCLDKTAGDKSRLLIDTGVFEHGDLSPAEQECQTGVGENIAYTTGGDPATIAHEFVFDIWANSTDGHREAMLSTEYTHIGVDVTDNGGGFHATQQFATRDKSEPVELPQSEPVSAEAPPAEPAAIAGAPPTGLKAEAGLTPDALNLLRTVHQKWPGLDIGGVRADAKPDHPSGRALDIMTGGNSCSPVGQEIADWARQNHEALGVHYVIWCGEIWNVDRDGEGWRPNTGHRDHVHITVHGNSAA